MVVGCWAFTVTVFLYAPAFTVVLALYSHVSPGSSTPLSLVSPTANALFAPDCMTGVGWKSSAVVVPVPLSSVIAVTFTGTLPVFVTRYVQTAVVPTSSSRPGCVWDSSTVVGANGL